MAAPLLAISEHGLAVHVGVRSVRVPRVTYPPHCPALSTCRTDRRHRAGRAGLTQGELHLVAHLHLRQ